MITLEQICSDLKDMKVNFAPRTFWRYIELGLLPKGQKLKGKGNILYFPEDTVKRIAQIEFLKQDLGLPLRLLRKSSSHVLQDRFWESADKHPLAIDLIVWWAGVIARLDLESNTSLSTEDLVLLSEKTRIMFTHFTCD